MPGQAYSFGVVKAAQARGDFDVLAERGRRLLRVHLPRDVEAGLKTLAQALEQALRTLRRCGRAGPGLRHYQAATSPACGRGCRPANGGGCSVLPRS